VGARTHTEVTRRFLRATRDGSVAEPVGLLAPDVVLVSDGGGLRPAARRPVLGRDKVLRFAVGVLAKPEVGRPSVRACTVNGQAAVALGQVVAGEPDVLDSVLVLELDGGLVRSVLLLRNPDKLGGVRLG